MTYSNRTQYDNQEPWVFKHTFENITGTGIGNLTVHGKNVPGASGPSIARLAFSPFFF
jgi:hypothetical protein